jgi:hypothetical protein
MTINLNNVEVFEGHAFENKLLEELMGEIKYGQETQEDKWVI